jgi:uncharacterized protein (TIGR02597 family)
MKSKFLTILTSIALSFLFTIVSYAQSVSSTPVGYVTLTINGNGFTSLSNPLENAIVYSGNASGVSGSTITSSFAMTDSELSGTDPNGDSTHYLQTADGIILDITSNTTSTITVGQDISSLISDGDSISVKQHSTLGDLLGTDNSIGLTSGADINTSDIIYVMSGDGSGTYSTYYYQTDPFGGFLGGDGWRTAGNTSEDMSGVTLAADDGVFVKRISAGDISLVVTGTVNTVEHRRDLPAGFSLVSYPFPVGTTLDDSGIYSATNGYQSGADINSSDAVYVIALNGSFTLYYRQTDPFGGFLGGDGWRIAGDTSTDVGDTIIPVGSSIIINHIGSGLAWTDALPYTL